MHYPFYPNNPLSENYEEFCHTQLVLHKPFRSQDELKRSNESWKDAYERSPIYKVHDPVNLRDEEEEKNAQEAPPAAAEEVPEWGILCDDQDDPYQVRFFQFYLSK